MNLKLFGGLTLLDVSLHTSAVKLAEELHSNFLPKYDQNLNYIRI